MDIETAKSEIIKIEPIFGKKALEHFNSLNLEQITAKELNRGMKHFYIRGISKLSENPKKINNLTHFFYYTGKWDSAHNRILFAMGLTGKEDTSWSSVVFNSQAKVHGSELNFPFRLDGPDSFELARYFLKKTKETYESLFS